MAHKDLHSAKHQKMDEFYTQLSDIESELTHYKDHFRCKGFFCNFDDPYVINFFHYFAYNFEALGIKKLITTCYRNQKIDLFSYQNADEMEKAVYIEYTGDKDGDRVPSIDEIGVKELKGDGDFRSKECIELLKQADIVVTNPPFSLFREYMTQLGEYDKKFLIIGNKNCITYREIFKLIKDNKIRTGYRNINNDMWFMVPDDAKYEKIVDGRKVKHIMAIWLTNLEVRKHDEDMVLYKKYTPEEYPKYDNYDAINVDVVNEIPIDYPGVMGVPITYLDKYNVNQFEIIELGNSRDNFTPNKNYINPKKHTKDGQVANGGAINCVLAIETDKEPQGMVYYTSDNSKYLIPPYARILIKNKKIQ